MKKIYTDILSNKFENETEILTRYLNELSWPDKLSESTKERSISLIEGARQRRRKPGEVETFLRNYGLNTDEGKALMTLAEALLRVPDSHTANLLIKDKVDSAVWSTTDTEDWILKATALGLNVSKKTLNSMVGKLGAPVIRSAVRQAMRMMGHQFVLGRTIEEALKLGKPFADEGRFFSYDMLGEGARTYEDADKYYEAYDAALDVLAKENAKNTSPHPQGISVKLSAISPEYTYAKQVICVTDLTAKLSALCVKAKEAGMRLTVDAEEADRLELSLQIIRNIFESGILKGWDGFGLAVQAYQKRALSVVSNISDMARAQNVRVHIRLVKGAYWDTEIKHAQELGHENYPVFTRKKHTDLSYLRCAQDMLKNRDVLDCLFATHNAYTIAALVEMTRDNKDHVEFQRLHGMGENLYAVLADQTDYPISIYAPVGPFPDLLPYLVRRLLENGANSSFVHHIFDEAYAAEDLSQDLIEDVKISGALPHPKIPLPDHIFNDRPNAKGIDLTIGKNVEAFQSALEKTYRDSFEAKSYFEGKWQNSQNVESLTSPQNINDIYGKAHLAESEDIETAIKSGKEAFEIWHKTPATERAAVLNKMADLMEKNMLSLMSICVREAGKTWDDAQGEVREAIDFCRYYAVTGTHDFNENGIALPGPTGEKNALYLEGRGVFVCISPWNFPLAIFLGQITAALMAGNAVLAKPAEQTPVIAQEAVKYLYEAGLPKNALQLILGAGDIGAALVEHKEIAGVAFTGSTEVAKLINKTLAAKEGAIAPLIAETGGQNALIADSSALPEQIVDDAILSAFGSAGQRCSALRVLCIQDDVADKVIEMLVGATKILDVGHPRHISTDLGPVIDGDAHKALSEKAALLSEGSTQLVQLELNKNETKNGHFIAPRVYEIASLDDLGAEIFGPIMRVYRYKAEDLDMLIDQINNTGYGLTLGIHSRIERQIQHIVARAKVGNIYVNRSQIGAVVGVQPFGGRGLSGTGPKAGGPFYLHRFATEKTVSIDTTASGGNTQLVSLEE